MAAPDPDLTSCTDLILVCCHAVYTGDGADVAESQWQLQSFQRSDPATARPGEHETMLAHILAGAVAVEGRAEKGLLIFSGGRTTAAPRSEAEGYEKVFLGLGGFPRARQRYALEMDATDSYQNLLFSVLRFHALVGAFPARITVVTHAFKERRFLELHGPTIKWPPSRLRVQGVNPPFTVDELRETQKGEQDRGFSPFVADPYGVRAPLADKRLKRNWSPAALEKIAQTMSATVRDLLKWEGGESGKEIFPGALPWEIAET